MRTTLIKISVHTLSIFVLLFTVTSVSGQSSDNLLPADAFIQMRDSSDAIDIILMTGEGGSISLDGEAVPYINSFFEYQPATPAAQHLGGTIMWLKKGRELISGSYYIDGETGYVVFDWKGEKFLHKISAVGVSFFNTQFNK